ncbi:MAG: DUF1566 domain-containing protein [Acidobacteria bacterium]|nr:DUF1566 domain-containing protein [Acidobacteriota bacterium]
MKNISTVPFWRVASAFLWLLLSYSQSVLAHPGGHGVPPSGELQQWDNVRTGERLRGTLLYTRGGLAVIEREDGRLVALETALLTADARLRIAAMERRRDAVNAPGTIEPAELSVPDDRAAASALRWWPGLLLIIVVLVLSWRAFHPVFLSSGRGHRARLPVQSVLLVLVLVGLSGVLTVRRYAQGAMPGAAAPFEAFAPKVRTRHDGQYLYVESDGLPEHQMMVGIRSWQQQVPIAQPYYSENAWRIPLNPVIAATPISARTALFTGAIALAANGIPIFNALNNRGVDSYAIGELDQFGGHCGRADDYHYHAAPVHLQARVGAGLPIGYALDGFPLYGLKEPDGSAVTGLDDLNGHYDSAGKYHYHSTLTYPYINGGMRGVVTVSNDQIVPQPRAWSVRPFTSPLNGATITGYTVTGANGWSLEYTLNGQLYRVNYGIDATGKYYFDFIDPTGAKRSESYSRRGMVTGLSAASYAGGAVGAESIVALFGSGLTSGTASVGNGPLPTELAGASVRVVDSLGTARLAPLFYASPTQINIEIPPGVSEGAAAISIGPPGMSATSFTGFGTVEIARVAPGLFTADASGRGYPAALVYRYRNGVYQSNQPVARYDQATNRVVAVPVDTTIDKDELYLALFGTGLRFRSGLGTIAASIGGYDAQVVFAGPQGDFVGLDQLNLRIPAALATASGEFEVAVTVDGKPANPVRLAIGKSATTASTWSMRKLPDTGQTGHFGQVYGEDSDYTIDAPAYSNNADGTITDRVTGLQWQQGDGGERSWDGASAYCDTLALAGRDDWRLPRLPELFSINQLNNVNPALDSAFTRTNAEYWWSSTLRADDPARAWATNAGGGAGPHPKSETVSAGGTKRFHVRCVREAEPPLTLAAYLGENRNGTVTDYRSGLVWQQAEVADRGWDEAIRYCEDLVLGGAGDWRLPSLREIRSINDESRVRPSIDSALFPATTAAPFWSSTTLVNQTTRAWTVDFTFGIASYSTKTDRLRLRCVRGGGDR